VKFLRVARLDDTDEHVYPRAAQVGEFAVPGSFAYAFSERDPSALQGKERQAFRHAFLGTGSFGFATVAVVAEVSEAGYKSVIEALAQHLVASYGAPNLEEALVVARAEVEYAAELCEHPVNTLLVVERAADAEGIHEAFKIVKPQADWGAAGTPVWQLEPEEEHAAPSVS
jgi:hypothetical protein